MRRNTRATYPKRGEVFMVNFDPTVGSEIRKTRPALILQNDIANRHSPVTIVAAITSGIDETVYPTEVQVRSQEGGLTADSTILLNQIRTIDNKRLIRRMGRLKPSTLVKVHQALEISLGLIDI